MAASQESASDIISNHDTSRRSTVRRLALVLLPLLAIAISLLQLHVVDSQMPLRKNDLVARWVGVRAVLRGHDPYSIHTIHRIQMLYYGRLVPPGSPVNPQPFLYPAHTVILLAPFALLRLKTAENLYLLISVPLLTFSLWLLFRMLVPRLTRTQTGALVLLTLAFWPVLWGIRLLQPTLLIATFLFFVAILLNRGRGTLAGILLALATIKPQLALPLILFLLLWSLYRRLWSFSLSFTASTAILLLATGLILPGWFPRWIATLHGYGKSHPLPLQIYLGHEAGFLLTATLLLWTAARLWRMRSSPFGSTQFASAFALALSATVCANFTLLPMIYNQILLLPAALLRAFARPASGYRSLVHRIAMCILVAGFLAVPVAVLAETILGRTPFWESLPFMNNLLAPALTVDLLLDLHSPKSDVTSARAETPQATFTAA